jgi:hypothetical protein
MRNPRETQGNLYLQVKHYTNRGYGHIPTEPGRTCQPRRRTALRPLEGQA